MTNYPNPGRIKPPTSDEMSDILRRVRNRMGSDVTRSGIIIPSGVQVQGPIRWGNPSDEEEDQIPITVDVVVDSTLRSDGFANFDPQTLVFTVTIPPHVHVVDVNLQAVQNHFGMGRTIFAEICDYPDIFSLQIDDTSKPACKWYSPSAAEIDAGAEQVDGYPYNRPSKVSSCSNPAVSGAKNKYVPCPVVPQWSTCRYSELSQWETIQQAYDNDTLALSIRRTYVANKMPIYQLWDNHTNEVLVDRAEDITAIRDIFDKRCEEQSLVVHNPGREKRSYFKAVLS